MSWFSILPEQFSYYENWIVRCFLFLGFVSIAPWILLIVYDFLLYCWRTAIYEIPVVGGRAKGRQRPRAPSLAERPKELARHLSSKASLSPPQYDALSETSAPRAIELTGVALQRPETTFKDD